MARTTERSYPLRLPAELYERVQAAARADRRSVNSWLVVLIEQELERRARAPE